ncbi:golgin subfamily A member 2-like [Pollicipes pollicipes]|uniref:golgin subfamily A member 2-like n=1 Tax=Pollicipes pollicipes TaxID=41117 RepID=UPI001885546E|nr:golgin subfamily A member 2-like [Pollicipes pollicipes]
MTPDRCSTAEADDDNLAATCQDLGTWSETSIGSVATPQASRSAEYVPAAGMYGFQPPLGPPSRGSVEYLPEPDGTYTQGLCAFACPDSWPPTPPTPRSEEDVTSAGEGGHHVSPARRGQYMEGLNWDEVKRWPPTPETPSSLEDVRPSEGTGPGRTAPVPLSPYTQGLVWDSVKGWPPTPPTPSSKEKLAPEGALATPLQEGTPHAPHGKPPSGSDGEGHEPAQGEYGFQRYPQGYEPPQMWYGHEHASIASPRSSQDLGSQAVSSGDPSPRLDVIPRDGGDYEPAQGIYGFQRVFATDVSADAAQPAAAAAAESAENFDGPSPDTSRSLERIFEAGSPHPTVGEQRTLTPSPNLPAFLEKLTSSSESEDSASRQRRRPSESAPAVRVPRNRFYSMEEMCTTAPSPPNLALSSSSLHVTRSVRSGDQQCYLPWMHRAPVPYRSPQTAQFVDYQEPPLVDMDDVSSVPTPTSDRSRRSDSDKTQPSEPPGDYFAPAGGSSVDTPSSGRYEPPPDAASYDGPSPYTAASLQRIFDASTGGKQQESPLAGESKSVESAHNDIEDMLQRLRSLESRLHSVEDESQSKDRQIQDLLSRLEGLLTSGGADGQSDLNERLQSATETVAKLEETEGKLEKELADAKKEIDSYVAKLESYQGRSEEIEMRLAESQRLQAAGDQQLQELAQQCGQLAAERDQLARQLEESAAIVTEKEARVDQLVQQLQEYSDRVAQLEADLKDGVVPADSADIAAENQHLRNRVEELEQGQQTEEQWKEQAEEADERARAMEKALDQLASEKRTEEERRREVETQLVQMVRKTSVARVTASEDDTSATEESSADDLLDPQLCRRLQQLLDKLHGQGLQALNLVELRFVKAYATPSQLTPRALPAEAAVHVSDMDTATLQRALARLADELGNAEQEMNAKGVLYPVCLRYAVPGLSEGVLYPVCRSEQLPSACEEETGLVQELQTTLEAEHQTKLTLTERLSETRTASGALETELTQFTGAAELIRTTDAGCKDLARVMTCLAKLDGAGDQIVELCADPGNQSAVKRLAEELLAEQQRCRDMLACLECERGRAGQLSQELDQGRAQAQADGKTSEQLGQRVSELEQRSEKLRKQTDAACAEAQEAGTDDQAPLEAQVKRLLQELRQVQGARQKAADDVQKPAAELSQLTADLRLSAADALTTWRVFDDPARHVTLGAL